MARLLLEHGAALVGLSIDGRPSYSAIHAARSAEMVQFLLDNNANPEQLVHCNGYGPLHYYTIRGNMEAMRTLLLHGVDVNSSVRACTPTPLNLAAERNIEAVKLLLEHGAEGKLRCVCSETPLHGAVRAGKIDVVRLLLERLPDDMRNEEDYSGQTPLHLAAYYGNAELVELLVKGWPKGKAVRARNGQTPLSEYTRFKTHPRKRIIALLGGLY
jgi:ankyrin repeat protein